MKSNSLCKYFLFVSLLSMFGCAEKKTLYPESLTTAFEKLYNENENEQVLAEVQKVLATNPDKETRQLCTLLTSAALCESSHVDSAYTIFKTIRPEKLNKQNLFWYNSIKGLLLFRQNRLTESYKTILPTIKFRDIDIRALSLNERILARISFTLSDQHDGIEWLTASTGHFEEAGLIKNTGINLKILGRHYMNNHNYGKAIHSFQKAEKIFVKYNDKAELFYIYINIIDYCLITNQLEAARHYANRCFTECNDVMDNSMRALAYNNLGEIEMKLLNFDKATFHYNNTLQLPDNYSTVNIRRTNPHRNLSKIHLLKNEPVEALQQMMLARRYLPDNGYLELRHKTYNELAATHKAINKIEAAYAYLDTANMYLDSSFQILNKTTRAFYDTKVELSETSHNLKKIKNTERRNRYIALAIISGLLVFGAIGSFIHRQQISKNKVLTALVQKNILLMEEERKSKQAQQTHNKRKNGGQSTDADIKNQKLYQLFVNWLETDKNFTRKDITLEIVSKELNTNREYLSRAISEQNMRFNDLINKYRVEEVIAILTDPKNLCSKYNLAIIGSQAGFTSNSVFIEAFHKQTGMNPAEFRKITCIEE